MNAEVRCVDDNDDEQPDDRCAAAAAAVDDAGEPGDESDWRLRVTVRPSEAMPCSVPCDRAISSMSSSRCLFSHWTAWSPCSRRCDGRSTRVRFMEGQPHQFFPQRPSFYRGGE